MNIDDAARPVGTWGILRVRAITPNRVLLEADDYIAWYPLTEVEYLHTPSRWVGWETD